MACAASISQTNQVCERRESKRLPGRWDMQARGRRKMLGKNRGRPIASLSGLVLAGSSQGQ